MSGPYRNHVEARSSRAPARQFVSETHDHKPDARGGSFAPLEPNAVDPLIAELLVARNRLTEEVGRLDVKLRDLTRSRQQGLAVSVALAAEETAKIAGQIQALSTSLHKGIAGRLELEARA